MRIRDRIASGLAIAALLLGNMVHASKIEVSQINNFNGAVDAEITIFGVPNTRQVTAGTGLTGGGALSADRTISLDLTRANTWTGAGTFSAGLIGNLTGNVTGDVSGTSGSTTGNAATATALATGRTISITGDLAYTSPSFTGASNVTAAGTLATVNSNVGACGDATHVGVVTLNAKGLATACTATAISGYLQVASNLSDVASASTSRTNLGLGTSAVQNTGTSGATVPLLSTLNTWTTDQIYVGNIQYNPSAVTLGTSATIDAVRPISADGRGSTGAIMRSTGETGGSGFQAIRVSSDTTGPTNTLRKARGTVASLASVQNGDSLGMMIWSGYASTPSVNSLSVARIDTIITEPTPTTSVMGGDMVISTIKIGTNTTTTDLRISADTGITASGNVNVGALLSLHNYVVSGLPTCNGTTQGSLAYVTDALSPTYLGVLTGGGTTKSPVFCNGSAWVPS